MGLAEPLLTELLFEAVSARKVLERVPEDKFDWAPHEKSLPFGRLASHVADIPGFTVMTIEEDELVIDPQTPTGFQAANPSELLDHFDERVDAATRVLETVDDERLAAPWRMRMGDHLVIDSPRTAVLRTWVSNHMIHHRAQLSVYLRLNDIPVPSIYGRSADESTW